MKKSRVIGFGTGWEARKLITFENELCILFFVDNRKKPGIDYYSYPVHNPQIISEIIDEYDYVIITSTKFELEMKEQLVGQICVPEKKIITLKDISAVIDYDFNDADAPEYHSDSYEVKIRNIQEYDNWISDKSALYEYENLLKKLVLLSSKKRFFYPGKCQICNEDVRFLLKSIYPDEPKKFALRETMTCPVCTLFNRQRMIVQKVMDEVEKTSKIYLTEQKSQLYNILKKSFPNLIGSEYLSPEMTGGTISKDGIRHENLMQLSFADEELDYIVSCDVFEHVADMNKAIREMYRVLRPGGIIYATIPFKFNQEFTVQRARIQKCETIYIEEPRYHGNPIDSRGSLVFYDYGYDLLQWFREAGFQDAYFQPYYSVLHGNIGIKNLLTMIAMK